MAVHAGRRGSGRDQGWQDGLPAGAREMPVPASYNDVFPEPEMHDHVGDVWYETTGRGSRRAGPVSGSCCASARPPIARWCGSTAARSQSTRAVTRRSRPMSPASSSRAPRTAITVVVNNILTGSRSRPATWSRPPTARASTTSTTSSITPACTGRSGSIPRRRRTSATSPSSPAWPGPPGPSITGSRPRAPTACRCASC